MIHETHAFETFPIGMHVTVHSLTGRQDLNETKGTIIATKNKSGRFGVCVSDESVRVKGANLKPTAVVNGVRFRGTTDRKETVVVGINDTFVKCPLPHAVGIPLVAFLEPWTPGESPHYKGIFLMDDLKTGLAPIEWQYGGCNGPMPWMRVARTDGVDFSIEELDVLIEYIMDRFNDGPVKVDAADFEQFCNDDDSK